jgi:hypothetical protein
MWFPVLVMVQLGAGADELYKLLDRVRLARTGSDKQGREIKAEKYLPT